MAEISYLVQMLYYVNKFLLKSLAHSIIQDYDNKKQNS